MGEVSWVEKNKHSSLVMSLSAQGETWEWNILQFGKLGSNYEFIWVFLNSLWQTSGCSFIFRNFQNEKTRLSGVEYLYGIVKTKKIDPAIH